MTVEASGKTATKTIWRLDVAKEEETTTLAADIAKLLVPGDIVTLAGDLGAGKTTFARALIRAVAHDPTLEAPSPTFTLMQVYEGDFGKIVHADFYRIETVADVAELGWEEACEGALLLVEWAERARELFSGDRLDIRLSFAEPERRDARMITISGYGPLLRAWRPSSPCMNFCARRTGGTRGATSCKATRRAAPIRR